MLNKLLNLKRKLQWRRTLYLSDIEYKSSGKEKPRWREALFLGTAVIRLTVAAGRRPA